MALLERVSVSVSVCVNCHEVITHCRATPVGWPVSLPHFRMTVVRRAAIGYILSLVPASRHRLAGGKSHVQHQPIDSDFKRPADRSGRLMLLSRGFLACVGEFKVHILNTKSSFQRYSVWKGLI